MTSQGDTAGVSLSEAQDPPGLGLSHCPEVPRRQNQMWGLEGTRQWVPGWAPCQTPHLEHLSGHRFPRPLALKGKVVTFPSWEGLFIFSSLFPRFYQIFFIKQVLI